MKKKLCLHLLKIDKFSGSISNQTVGIQNGTNFSSIAPHASDRTDDERHKCNNYLIYLCSIPREDLFLALYLFIFTTILSTNLFFFSEHYQIKRTCTDDFDVNFFMVNHACMTEGHRHGHMCFCEEDECNTASSNLLQQPLTTLGIPLALTLLLGAFPR